MSAEKVRAVHGPDEARLETYDGPAVTLTDELVALYAAVYAEPPPTVTAADVAEFVAEWPGLLSQPGSGSSSRGQPPAD